MSSFTLQVVLGSVTTSGIDSTFFGEFMYFNSSSLNGSKVTGWSFRSLALNGTARRAKFGTNCQDTLHNPRNERSSEMFGNSFSPLIVLVVCGTVL